MLKDKVLIDMVSLAINTDLYTSLIEENITVLVLDDIPRILLRVQAYNVLSSQANIAGYRAVIEATSCLMIVVDGCFMIIVDSYFIIVVNSCFMIVMCTEFPILTPKIKKDPFDKIGLSNYF